MGTYIELNTFIKIKGHATTGGEAKQLIREGKVTVNGKIEMQNKKKLISGDKVKIENKTYTVSETECKKYLYTI